MAVHDSYARADILADIVAQTVRRRGDSPFPRCRQNSACPDVRFPDGDDASRPSAKALLAAQPRTSRRDCRGRLVPYRHRHRVRAEMDEPGARLRGGRHGRRHPRRVARSLHLAPGPGPLAPMMNVVRIFISDYSTSQIFLHIYI